jgi:fatty acid desaturase
MAKAPLDPMKRRLSEAQEFEVMKLILDKFLWLGFAVMAFGLWTAYTKDIYNGLIWLIVGAVILLLFTWIITKEYEIIR